MEWHVAFKDDQKEHRFEIERAELHRFDDAAKAGALDGRALRGMWIIDDTTEHADVIRVHGLAPREIHVRHEAYKQMVASKKGEAPPK